MAHVEIKENCVLGNHSGLHTASFLLLSGTSLCCLSAHAAVHVTGGLLSCDRFLPAQTQSLVYIQSSSTCNFFPGSK